MSKNTAKAQSNNAKAEAVSAKLAKLLKKNGEAEKKSAEGKGKVLDLKSKLKTKAKTEGPVSCITNPKEREKLARYGIECVVVHNKDLGENAAEVRVDGDLVVIGIPDRDEAISVAMGLYEHIKSTATKLAKQMSEE